LNLKVLFITFLILISLSAICSVALPAPEAPTVYSENEPLAGSYLTLDGDEPDGDPKPPVWPE